jgi:hypothetical protein
MRYSVRADPGAGRHARPFFFALAGIKVAVARRLAGAICEVLIDTLFCKWNWIGSDRDPILFMWGLF